jgi:uncharacterized protein involved in outer membrane biogenesis
LQPLTAAAGELTGRIRIDRTRRLDGQVHVTVADVARTASTAETFLGQAPGSLLPVPVNGAVSLDARLGGTVEQPIASLTVSAPSLSAGAANGIELGADLTVSSEAARITRAEANWNGAHAALNGEIKLTRSQALDLGLDADAKDLQHVFPSGVWGTPLSGRISGRGTI